MGVDRWNPSPPDLRFLLACLLSSGPWRLAGGAFRLRCLVGFGLSSCFSRWVPLLFLFGFALGLDAVFRCVLLPRYFGLGFAEFGRARAAKGMRGRCDRLRLLKIVSVEMRVIWRRGRCCLDVDACCGILAGGCAVRVWSGSVFSSTELVVLRQSSSRSILNLYVR